MNNRLPDLLTMFAGVNMNKTTCFARVLEELLIKTNLGESIFLAGTASSLENYRQFKQF